MTQRQSHNCAYLDVEDQSNLCRNPDNCQYQMFGKDNDPVYCMKDEIIALLMKKQEIV